MKDEVINTTLCYIKRNNEYLMLHRVKKENDLNHDKYIGIGGKFEKGESPEECLLREVKEETGLRLLSYVYRGIITFDSEGYETEYMHLFTSDRFEGELSQCDEGIPEWISMEKFLSLPRWEGDILFMKLMETDRPFFSMKLSYKGDVLIYAALDGKTIYDPSEGIDDREYIH